MSVGLILNGQSVQINVAKFLFQPLILASKVANAPADMLHKILWNDNNSDESDVDDTCDYRVISHKVNAISVKNVKRPRVRRPSPTLPPAKVKNSEKADGVELVKDGCDVADRPDIGVNNLVGPKVSVKSDKRPSVKPSCTEPEKKVEKADEVEMVIKVPIPPGWTKSHIESFTKHFEGQLLSYQTGEFVNDRYVKLIFKKNRHGSITVVPPIGKVDPQVRIDGYVDMR